MKDEFDILICKEEDNTYTYYLYQNKEGNLRMEKFIFHDLDDEVLTRIQDVKSNCIIKEFRCDKNGVLDYKLIRYYNKNGDPLGWDKFNDQGFLLDRFVAEVIDGKICLKEIDDNGFVKSITESWGQTQAQINRVAGIIASNKINKLTP